MAKNISLGEENEFLPTQFSIPKPNTLSSYLFQEVVAMLGMSNAHCPRYQVMPNRDGSKAPYV